MTSPVDHNYLKWVEAKRAEQDAEATPALSKAIAGLGTGMVQWVGYLISCAQQETGRTSAPQWGERQA